MNRRNFLKSSVIIAVAPAIVKAENIMKIWVPSEKRIILGFDPGVDDRSGRIQIYEQRVFDRCLSDSEISNIVDEMKKKWWVN